MGAAFAAPPAGIGSQVQATLFETNDNSCATRFHRAWLLKTQPDDPQLYDELQGAHNRWKATTDGKEILLPSVVREILVVQRAE